MYFVLKKILLQMFDKIVFIVIPTSPSPSTHRHTHTHIIPRTTNPTACIFYEQVITILVACLFFTFPSFIYPLSFG